MYTLFFANTNLYNFQRRFVRENFRKRDQAPSNGLSSNYGGIISKSVEKIKIIKRGDTFTMKKTGGR